MQEPFGRRRACLTCAVAHSCFILKLVCKSFKMNFSTSLIQSGDYLQPISVIVFLNKLNISLFAGDRSRKKMQPKNLYVNMRLVLHSWYSSGL